MGKTSWRLTGQAIANKWYGKDEIYHALQQRGPANLGPFVVDVPIDVRSREFSDWLTDQYRMAMAKGVQLGRDGSEDQLG